MVIETMAAGTTMLWIGEPVLVRAGKMDAEAVSLRLRPRVLCLPPASTVCSHRLT